MLNRRLLLSAALAAPTIVRTPAHAQTPATPQPPIKAIAFDGFVIIDPRPVAALAETFFPGRGPALMDAWRTRQFEYTWLRTLEGRYVGFRQVTEEALTVAAHAVKIELTADARAQLMQSFFALKAWPDVVPALRLLKEKGIRMAFLANPPNAMFDAVVRNSGLDGLLEAHLSTDRVQAYKPDRRAYQMGLDAFGFAREEIAFAASASWDAAGAKAFGYRSFWVNRANLPAEQLGAEPDAIGAGMAELVRFVTA